MRSLVGGVACLGIREKRARLGWVLDLFFSLERRVSVLGLCWKGEVGDGVGVGGTGGKEGSRYDLLLCYGVGVAGCFLEEGALVDGFN
jgi:hypothetical protein